MKAKERSIKNEQEKEQAVILLLPDDQRADLASLSKITTVGTENLPKGEALLVGNHCQMHGPIACELYFPGNRYTWCAGEMMHLKEVPSYAYQDFWSGKPKYIR